MKLDTGINTGRNSRHYDYIAEAWRHILGENFHWGYFRKAEDSLELATTALIKVLVSDLGIGSSHRLLDVGCGIGEPARYLAQQYACHVSGFSTSEEGIARARELSLPVAEKKLLTFEVRNALDNGFPDEAFDSAIVLEMSHLIHDKVSLIEETCRSIKMGGTIALCDLTLHRRLSAREIADRFGELQLLERCFGKARLEPLGEYEKFFAHCGLEILNSTDVTTEVTPTIAAWRQNAERRRATLLKYVAQQDVDDFIVSCDILEKYFYEGIWGYSIIVGRKVEATSTQRGSLGKALF